MNTRIAHGLVAQICNLLYRRVALGKARENPEPFDLAPPTQNAILRYSKVRLCATCRRHSANVRGVTRTEVIFIVAASCVIVLLGVAEMPQATARARRIQCSGNLVMIGFGLKTWAMDHHDQYPTQVTGTNGGSQEAALAGMAAPIFEVVSNELFTPKTLICPADRARVCASAFSGHLGNSNVSYFVNVEIDDHYAWMFAAGDRNVTTNGAPLASGAVHLLRTNSLVAWTAAIHRDNGNVLLVALSVQQWNSAALRAALRDSGTTNRIAVP